MRPILFGIAIGVGLVLGLFVGSIIVSAQTEVPEGVQVFQLDTGQTCVVWPDGSGDCYCPCETGLCAVEADGLAPRPTGTDAISGEETPTSVRPTNTAVVEPSGTPVPTSTPVVEPTKTPKPHCNKGEGNGGEDCDPGNHPENGNDDED